MFRRTASEVVRDLEVRVARLEKLAKALPLSKKVMTELEEVLSQNPFDFDQWTVCIFNVSLIKARALEALSAMDQISDNYYPHRYEVDAKVTLVTDLILDDAMVMNPRVKLHHFVDAALTEANLSAAGLRGSHDIEIRKIGTPSLTAAPGGDMEFSVPVKLVLVADQASDFMYQNKVRLR